jgi:hypothetical protein
MWIHQELVRHNMIQKKTMLRRLEQTDMQQLIRCNNQTRNKCLVKF